MIKSLYQKRVCDTIVETGRIALVFASAIVGFLAMFQELFRPGLTGTSAISIITKFGNKSSVQSDSQSAALTLCILLVLVCVAQILPAILASRQLYCMQKDKTNNGIPNAGIWISASLHSVILLLSIIIFGLYKEDKSEGAVDSHALVSFLIALMLLVGYYMLSMLHSSKAEDIVKKDRAVGKKPIVTYITYITTTIAMLISIAMILYPLAIGAGLGEIRVLNYSTALFGMENLDDDKLISMAISLVCVIIAIVVSLTYALQDEKSRKLSLGVTLTLFAMTFGYALSNMVMLANTDAIKAQGHVPMVVVGVMLAIQVAALLAEKKAGNASVDNEEVAQDQTQQENEIANKTL